MNVSKYWLENNINVGYYLKDIEDYTFNEDTDLSYNKFILGQDGVPIPVFLDTNSQINILEYEEDLKYAAMFLQDKN